MTAIVVIKSQGNAVRVTQETIADRERVPNGTFLVPAGEELTLVVDENRSLRVDEMPVATPAE